MARPRQNSKIQIPPRIKGFTPMGYYSKESKPINLNIEEFEAIRLLDYEDMSQVEAAVIMEISRPTLTRIYDRARKKIAKALTESQQILISGGKTIFNGNWYECENCSCKFDNPNKKQVTECPLCSDNKILKLEDEK